MRRMIVPLSVLILAAAAACTDVTAPAAGVPDARGPRGNAGTLGTGHRTEDGKETGAGTAEATSEAGTCERGGGTLGTGHLVCEPIPVDSPVS